MTLAAYQQRLLDLAFDYGALGFGEFTLKSGRISPYFFNLAAINDGAGWATLGRCYAEHCHTQKLAFDGLFGPAYKGIPLATAVAIGLWQDYGRRHPVSFDRKESKAHGEGGHVLGAPLTGQVLIVDDVVTAGTAAQSARATIEAAGAHVAGVVIALDRQERGADERPALTALAEALEAPVSALVTLDDLLAYLELRRDMPAERIDRIRAYRDAHGASARGA